MQDTRIAEFLLDIGAVRLSVHQPFTWTSGIKSPIYCDNRMVYSHPDARDFIVDALTSRVKNLHIPADVIAGTATAAIGWAALVADRLQLPFVYVRSKAKEHGAKKRIEGDLKEEQHVVVIEDLISTGGSAVSTAEALREEGKAVVTDVVSIFSYELLNAREKALEAGLQFHPLSTLHALLDVALDQDRLIDEEAELVEQFAHDPEHWQGI
ncbi:MAG TPA: orotate phosphoribosyltransferase [Candidatus Peribacteraceae bacterium]|nr:orotate phosphoribosyltransferase [Candidatus Peribacteraceae bacterium]